MYLWNTNDELFYNDSISPVTKMIPVEDNNIAVFYNDSISPVTKIRGYEGDDKEMVLQWLNFSGY